MKVSIFVRERQNTLSVYVVSSEECASTAADVDAVHDARKAKLANSSGNAWTRNRKDYAFRRHFNENPSITRGWAGMHGQ